MKRYTFRRFYEPDKLTGLNFKAAPWNDRFLIQQRLFPVEFAGTPVSPKEVKRLDSTFGSVADRSTIHVSFNHLTKPAGSYKQSYHLKVF